MFQLLHLFLKQLNLVVKSRDHLVLLLNEFFELANGVFSLFNIFEQLLDLVLVLIELVDHGVLLQLVCIVVNHLLQG